MTLVLNSTNFIQCKNVLLLQVSATPDNQVLALEPDNEKVSIRKGNARIVYWRHPEVRPNKVSSLKTEIECLLIIY